MVLNNQLGLSIAKSGLLPFCAHPIIFEANQN